MKLFRLFSLISLIFISQSITAELITIQTKAQFESYSQMGKPFIIEFFATWCGACNRIKPKVVEWAQKYKDINFLLVDESLDLKSRYGVKAFPTFIFVDAQGNERTRIVGRDEAKMVEAIKQLRTTKEMPVVVKETQKEPEIKKEEPKPAPVLPSKPTAVITSMDKNITELENDAHLETIKAKKQPMMFDFYTVWCGPCKQMKPMIENELSKEYSDVIFVTIDAEKFPKLASQHKVTGYPTFVFMDAQGTEITRMSGACEKMMMQGKLNQISSKKSNVIIMDEKEMMAKMQGQQKMMPQPIVKKPRDIKTQPIKKTPAKKTRKSERSSRK